MSFRREPLERGSPRSADHPDVAAALAGRIATVAVIVVTQLWALTAALDAWFERDAAGVWWLLVYQALAFIVCLVIWTTRPGERDVARR